METKTNQKRGQESLSSLASMLWASKDMNTVQVNNNMNTLVMAKEQYVQKTKPSTDNVGVTKETIKSYSNA